MKASAEEQTVDFIAAVTPENTELLVKYMLI